MWLICDIALLLLCCWTLTRCTSPGGSPPGGLWELRSRQVLRLHRRSSPLREMHHLPRRLLPGRPVLSACRQNMPGQHLLLFYLQDDSFLFCVRKKQEAEFDPLTEPQGLDWPFLVSQRQHVIASFSWGRGLFVAYFWTLCIDLISSYRTETNALKLPTCVEIDRSVSILQVPRMTQTYFYHF